MTWEFAGHTMGALGKFMLAHTVDGRVFSQVLGAVKAHILPLEGSARSRGWGRCELRLRGTDRSERRHYSLGWIHVLFRDKARSTYFWIFEALERGDL